MRHDFLVRSRTPIRGRDWNGAVGNPDGVGAGELDWLIDAKTGEIRTILTTNRDSITGAPPRIKDGSHGGNTYEYGGVKIKEPSDVFRAVRDTTEMLERGRDYGYTRLKRIKSIGFRALTAVGIDAPAHWGAHSAGKKALKVFKKWSPESLPQTGRPEDPLYVDPENHRKPGPKPGAGLVPSEKDQFAHLQNTALAPELIPPLPVPAPESIPRSEQRNPEDHDGWTSPH